MTELVGLTFARFKRTGQGEVYEYFAANGLGPILDVTKDEERPETRFYAGVRLHPIAETVSADYISGLNFRRLPLVDDIRGGAVRFIWLGFRP